VAGFVQRDPRSDLEPSTNFVYVHIDVPEDLDIQGRAGSTSRPGAFLDMVVTHLLQIRGIVALECALPY